MIIGITGKSGAGKTSICEELEKRRGFLVIDADKIVTEISSDDIKSYIENKRA